MLDIDETFDAVHGGQQLRLLNGFHYDYGFQPIVVFDGEGRFISAILRPAKRPKGHRAGQPQKLRDLSGFVIQLPCRDLEARQWNSAPSSGFRNTLNG